MATEYMLLITGSYLLQSLRITPGNDSGEVYFALHNAETGGKYTPTITIPILYFPDIQMNAKDAGIVGNMVVTF